MTFARALVLSLTFSLAALTVAGSLPAHAAAQCDIPETTLEGDYAAEMSDAFTGFIMENSTGLAQDYFAEKLIQQYMTKAADADGIMSSVKFSIQSDVVRVSNDWIHVLKAATIAKSISQGEIEPITGWVQDEVTERSVDAFLKYMGASSSVPVAGIVVTGLKIVKESYDELEVQDCLLNIDNAYYNFLEDGRLRTDEEGKLKKGAVEAYIKDYLFGGGDAPGGTTRAQNRRTLQCYVNNTLPEAERVEVSSLGPDSGEAPTNPVSWFSRVFGTIGDVAGSAADVAPGAKRLKTPVAVMLRDFNNRYDIELEARKITRLRQSAEYAQFEATIDAMKTSAMAAEWLCDRLSAKSLGDVAGAWQLFLTLEGVDGILELPPVDFSLPENGLVLTEMRNEQGDLVIEGKVSNGRAALDVLQKGWDDDLKAMVTALNIDLDGEHEGPTMSGKFDGTTIDWACVFEDMFDDDAPARTCPQVPAKGSWRAAKK